MKRANKLLLLLDYLDQYIQIHTQTFQFDKTNSDVYFSITENSINWFICSQIHWSFRICYIQVIISPLKQCAKHKPSKQDCLYQNVWILERSVHTSYISCASIETRFFLKKASKITEKQIKNRYITIQWRYSISQIMQRTRAAFASGKTRNVEFR